MLKTKSHKNKKKETQLKNINFNSRLKVEWVGDVVILNSNGLKAVIPGVFLVPKMKCNLLSIGQLIQKGFTTIIENYDRIELFDVNNNLILRSNLSKNKTFQVNMRVADVQHLSTIKSNDCRQKLYNPVKKFYSLLFIHTIHNIIYKFIFFDCTLNS